MNKELKFKAKESSHITKIVLGMDYVLSQKLPTFIEKSKKRLAIITDTQLEKTFRSALQYLGIPIFSFSPGEESKTRETKAILEDHLLSHNFGKDSLLIGFGGGVVSDMSGFLSATYMRGIPHIQIPTSLLSMVDASLGGKTAINTPYGKNTIGAFYPSEEIWIDGAFLTTLPKRQWINGTVELIKAGLIDSPFLFNEMLHNHPRWNGEDMPFVMDRIEEGVSIKKKIVEADYREKNGMRRMVNFGHTFGHAIEILENFQLQHGEAVAIGILVASFISKELGFLSEEDLDKVQQIFSLYEVPLTIPRKYDIEELMKIFARDKKARGGTPRFVLLKAIGEVAPFDGEYCTEVDFTLLEKATHWMHEKFYHPA